MEKKAIKYIRFSSDDQSLHSTERQDLVISNWVKFNNVIVIDSFKDEGYSARTFDRPDVKQLFAFIKKNYRNIDYLIVSELTRFSRETGDALNMVKQIQKDYGIRIVSASRGQIYDCNDSSSFFMMGLEFLLGNSENIKRTSDINGGIYTAKTEKGKYIGSHAPYGYIKEGPANDRRLVISPAAAEVVRFIFHSYLANVPDYMIKADAKTMGFPLTGNDALKKVLTNPVYMGYQQVKEYKNFPGGLFALKNHENIIEPAQWYRVQEKLSGIKQKRTITDEFPLRGLLKCHCSRPLTGAMSTGKTGKKFPYYKCHKDRNNISAVQAHDKMQRMLHYLSLPDYVVEVLLEDSAKLNEEKLQQNQTLINSTRQQLVEVEKQLHSIEEKWISNEMAADTFHKWHRNLSSKKIQLNADIQFWSRDTKETWFLLYNELEKLTDLQYLYNHYDTTAKQELLRIVFDNSLYYQSGGYRTPYLMETFTHNALILKQEQLLVIDKWDYKNNCSPVRWS